MPNESTKVSSRSSVYFVKEVSGFDRCGCRCGEGEGEGETEMDAEGEADPEAAAIMLQTQGHGEDLPPGRANGCSPLPSPSESDSKPPNRGPATRNSGRKLCPLWLFPGRRLA